jgi:hypothetical protein
MPYAIPAPTPEEKQRRRDLYNARRRRWKARHLQQERARVRRAYAARNGKIAVQKARADCRKEILTLLGGRCANPNCSWLNSDGLMGCTDDRCLQIDHVNGGGNTDTKTVGPQSMYLRIRRELRAGEKEKYQLLCANCNWIKRTTHHEVEKRYA